jgi:hypothetical protein
MGADPASESVRIQKLPSGTLPHSLLVLKFVRAVNGRFGLRPTFLDIALADRDTAGR